MTPELRGWAPKVSANTPKLPPPSLRFIEAQAAVEFGVALDEFRRKTMDARAEMIAFVLARTKREAWLDEERRRIASEKSSGGFNPLDVQKRKWRL